MTLRLFKNRYLKVKLMFLFKRLLVVVVLSSVIAGCNSMPEVSSQCKEPRPQMCTMIYQPVCGIDKLGQFKTYSSDCNACSHVNVTGYNEDACEDGASIETQGQQ